MNFRGPATKAGPGAQEPCDLEDRKRVKGRGRIRGIETVTEGCNWARGPARLMSGGEPIGDKGAATEAILGVEGRK